MLVKLSFSFWRCFCKFLYMRYLFHILIFFLIACQSYKTIKAEDSKQHSENHQADKQVIGEIVKRSGPLECQWIICINDREEIMPVKWPPEIKTHQQKIKFAFKIVRAPQPSCFKGKMVVIENYKLIK